MKGYGHILAAVASEVWAVQPEKLMAIVGFLDLKAAGGLPEADVLTRIQADATRAAVRAQAVGAASGGSVAVLPLFGLIMQRGNMMGDISGPRGTSVQQFTQSFRAAVNDPAVQAVVIDVDSPGGTVAGVQELAAEILAARKQKPIIAVSDCLMASAAYWIACACTEIVVSPSSMTGSIGVYTVHKDMSKALDAAGVKVTLVSYGANKTLGNDTEPLSDAGREELQAAVTYYGQMFEKAVARGRGVKASDVAGKFGAGKVFNAQKAVSSGMADSIGTLDDVLARFGVSRNPGAATARAITPIAISAATAAPRAGQHGCTCPCGACMEDDCPDCETADCDFAGCTCDAAMASGKAKSEAAGRAVFAHRARELQLAAFV